MDWLWIVPVSVGMAAVIVAAVALLVPWALPFLNWVERPFIRYCNWVASRLEKPPQ